MAIVAFQNCSSSNFVAVKLATENSHQLSTPIVMQTPPPLPTSTPVAVNTPAPRVPVTSHLIASSNTGYATAGFHPRVIADGKGIFINYEFHQLRD